MRILLLVITSILLQGCFGTEYELKKYYKDPNSAAARMMGGTYAGESPRVHRRPVCLSQATLPDSFKLS